MRRMAIAALAVGVFVIGVCAQTPTSKPGDEQKRIGFFEGKWKFEGEAKPSPMGPGGKIMATETCKWFPGGFHLVCQSEGTGPMGPAKSQSVMGYDPSEKTYTYYAISSLGEGFFVRGNTDSKVWTWNAENTVNGKPMKIRVTITEQSPTTYGFKMEASFDGGDWAVLEEGKATKAS
jgi:hypothetical protein